ncbi:hypothetical protein B0G84_0237 [Paraburkholderia sp. BL8N3]|nr:hypothetical protein [Paraburkholderia sp. BL8N3]TCK41970.1 hypothetical protein B0G84_0237 [Paraburkholderia sp. BL8N3]
MKSRLILAAAAALLLVAAGPAFAGDAYQATQPVTPDTSAMGQPSLQHNAKPSQSAADPSYGGTPATRSAAGKMTSRTCLPGPQCDIFFGN